MPNFLNSVLAAPLPIIMEVKRLDPHGEDLFAGRSVEEIVSLYRSVGAPCLSVVTGKWFGGDMRLLSSVARACSLPLLAKDFFTSRSKILEAKDLGASAVLLTAKLLPRAVFNDLIGETLDQGLTPFIEIAAEEELDGLTLTQDCIVAINNKDILTRERDPADFSRSLTLLPVLAEKEIRCPVSASGIVTPEGAAAMIEAGFAGLLIGSGLLKAPDLAQWVASFQAARQGESSTNREAAE